MNDSKVIKIPWDEMTATRKFADLLTQKFNKQNHSCDGDCGCDGNCGDNCKCKENENENNEEERKTDNGCSCERQDS